MRIATMAMFVVLGCGDNRTADSGDATSPDAGSTTTGSGSASPDGYPDISGYGTTTFSTGADPSNAFYTALGTNDRACVTCHDVTTGWTVTPQTLGARFAASQGMDPIFRLNDGATSPNADVSTLAARQAAYALLVSRGLIRIGLAVPTGADFTLTTVNDPYNYASAAELSLFRRPLPTTNLRFEATLMWDGREPSLEQQSIDATLDHAQAAGDPTSDQVAAIVAFESSLYTAQSYDNAAGLLLGPSSLATQTYSAGATNPTTFTLYASWLNAHGTDAAATRQASIARGENVFNTHRFQIRGVAGIPDQQGTCSTCHDTPNIGNHDQALMLDIGISDAQRRTPNLPLYTFSNGTTTRQSSDPGMALVTGKFADIGRFKVPSLRGVVMRPPYFHDGFAPTFNDVLNFYQQRFGVGFSPQDRTDLTAFLEAL